MSIHLSFHSVFAILLSLINFVNALGNWNPSAVLGVRVAQQNIVECYNGITFVKESYKDFRTRNIKIPNIQRQIDDERVYQFYSKIVKGFSASETKSLPYLGILTIGELDNTFQILDGQHRFRAYEKFSNNYNFIEFEVLYVRHACRNTEELVEIFRGCNDAFKLEDDVLNSLFAPAREMLKSHILKKYKKHVKPSQKPNYPNINLDSFIKDFLVMFEKTTEDGDQLVNILEDMNFCAEKQLRTSNDEKGLL